jgi:nitrogen fixation NifU-like protein
LSSLYTEIIQHAARYPRHRGELLNPTHTFEDENPLCGDVLRVQLHVENGCLTEARFQGQGCLISQAAIELLLDRIEHQPISTIDQLDHDVVLEELGLPAIAPARLKCALLSVAVLKGAIRSPIVSPTSTSSTKSRKDAPR